MKTTSFKFGTKAETLQRLQPLLGKGEILDVLYFNVQDWQDDRKAVVARIMNSANDKALVIRSSAQGEDGALDSMAGAFTSCLNIPAADANAISNAVDTVIGSFAGSNPQDQVLVQRMLDNIDISGVIMTHDIENGSPYYVINYDDESGLTDTITGGTGVHKTVLIYRNSDFENIESARIRKILHSVHELEEVCGNTPLDIEFALTRDGTVYILQVRRISLYKTWHPVTEKRVSRKIDFVGDYIKQRSAQRDGVLGRSTVLGVMPDWNPAEIIGTTPRPLAVSLYRELVTRNIWRKSRASMGYRDVPGEELMVVIDHHPYIDVRNSFNSFLPATLSEKTGTKLVDAWLERLKEHPELHDKVEFMVAQTCFDLTFDDDYSERYHGLLDAEELDEFRSAIFELTRKNLSLAEDGSLQSAMSDINLLAGRQERRSLRETKPGAELSTAKLLLEECQELGTHAFSILARHGFIAESMLRSMVRKGVLGQERVQAFKSSIHTITSDLATDYSDVCNGKADADSFLGKFGHLRPGTYDITSLRYDERADLFVYTATPPRSTHEQVFVLIDSESAAINRLLQQHGYDISSAELMEYASRAISAREYAKFVFTRNLSDALALIAHWGERTGLSRDDLSYLDLETIFSGIIQPVLDYEDRSYLEQADGARRSLGAAMTLKLSHLIRSEKDVYVVPLHRSMPNFITSKCIEADVIRLSHDTPATTVLNNKVVCIENADPGFDWVFTRGLGGLVTKFGGANSHMAIRCAEFSIPAAIGCGEQTFNRIASAGRVLLNCSDKILKPVQ